MSTTRYNQNDEIDYHTKLLTKTTSVTIIDLFKHAACLNDQLLSNLKEPEEGIYIKGTNSCIISKDRLVFARSDIKYSKPLSLKEIIETREAIVDVDGKTLMKASFTIDRKKFFTLEPYYLATAIKVVTAIALNGLSAMCPHFKVHPSLLSYNHLLKPEIAAMSMFEIYEEALDILTTEIINFIGDDRDFIYFHKTSGTNLILEKTVDYRIYKYYERLHQDAVESNDEEKCSKCRHCRF